MSQNPILARLRDFCLVALGTMALFVAVLLVLVRLRFPGLTESNLGGTYWLYLAVAAAMAACCAAVYAVVGTPLPKQASGV